MGVLSVRKCNLLTLIKLHKSKCSYIDSYGPVPQLPAVARGRALIKESTKARSTYVGLPGVLSRVRQNYLKRLPANPIFKDKMKAIINLTQNPSYHRSQVHHANLSSHPNDSCDHPSVKLENRKKLERADASKNASTEERQREPSRYESMRQSITWGRWVTCPKYALARFSL